MLIYIICMLISNAYSIDDTLTQRQNREKSAIETLWKQRGFNFRQRARGVQINFVFFDESEKRLDEISDPNLSE